MKRKKAAKQKPPMVVSAQELIINNTLRSTRSQRKKDGNEKPLKAMIEMAMAQQVILIIHKVFWLFSRFFLLMMVFNNRTKHHWNKSRALLVIQKVSC